MTAARPVASDAAEAGRSADERATGSPHAGAGSLDNLPGEASRQAALVERYLDDYLSSLKLPENLAGATRHALLAGGKRLRPLLVMNWCTASGGRVEDCLPAAAAVEMIHAFSLVHDDLPALDNDDLRRGRPTVHVAHGEAMAILAGDGLMSIAFQVISERCRDATLAGLLARELARGTTSMIAGQVLDTLGGFPPGLSPLEQLDLIHRSKTGALIRASCRMGAICGLWGRHPAPADEPALCGASTYGEAIGLMFQIVDDLLDVEQTATHTGKRTSKDQQAGKKTFPSIVGPDASRREIERLRRASLAAIEPLGPAADPLRRICEFLVVRTR